MKSKIQAKVKSTEDSIAIEDPSERERYKQKRNPLKIWETLKIQVKVESMIKLSLEDCIFQIQVKEARLYLQDIFRRLYLTGKGERRLYIWNNIIIGIFSGSYLPDIFRCLLFSNTDKSRFQIGPGVKKKKK